MLGLINHFKCECGSIWFERNTKYCFTKRDDGHIGHIILTEVSTYCSACNKVIKIEQKGDYCGSTEDF
jgi:hypothetical protein